VGARQHPPPRVRQPGQSNTPATPESRITADVPRPATSTLGPPATRFPTTHILTYKAKKATINPILSFEMEEERRCENWVLELVCSYSSAC
jgi:hypothetical protein